jgi:hypothetical protein
VREVRKGHKRLMHCSKRAEIWRSINRFHRGDRTAEKLRGDF